MPQRLIKNSKLTNRQLNELVKYFALEVPASRAAKVMQINRHSAERVYQVIRRCLARECELHSPLGGEVECDESYFGGRRKGPRGRGAAGKVPVFGLLKRNGKVYTRIVEDVSRKTLRQIIRTKVIPESVIYTDSFRSYDGLVLEHIRFIIGLGVCVLIFSTAVLFLSYRPPFKTPYLQISDFFFKTLSK